MTELEAFDFRGREVRVVTDEQGELWWVAADPCAVLGVGNTAQAVASLDDDEKRLVPISITDGNGRTKTLDTWVISEAGLYSLVLRSRKPEAKAFKRWVTHEVLPAIRKHGAYATPATVDQMLSDPDTMIRTLQALKEEREERRRAELAVRTVSAELEAVKPKADAWEAFLEKCPGDMSVAEAAKYLVNAGITIGQNRLYEWMRDHGWVYRLQTQKGVTGHKPYQHRVEAKHLRPGIKTIERGSRVIAHHEIRVTPRGLDLLRRQMLAGNVTPLPPTG